MATIEEIINNEYTKEQSQIQKICIDKLKKNPLPNRKNELWRLSNKNKFARFLNYSIKDRLSSETTCDIQGNERVIQIILGNKQKINIINNHWHIRELDEAEILNLIKEKLIKSDPDDNWSNLLNQSITNYENLLGLSISGENLPLIEILCNSQDNFLNAKTLILKVEDNAKINLSHINIGESNSALSISSYLFIGEKAVVNHGIISHGSNKSHLINSLNVFQKEYSEYNLGSLQFKLDFARLEIDITQTSGNAKTNIKGMQITRDNEQISTYAKIKFNGPNGFLDQLNKSLAKDTSHSVFEGLIIVPQVAQKTDASQLSRNLLLSNYAKIDTKPQLEIIADDVKCKHGATISQLNEDELFYMRSRGLTLEEASKLQLRSFYEEIISFIPIDTVRWNLLQLLLKNK